MTTDSETVEQYLNFVRTRFLISVLVFVSRDYELGRVSDFGGVDRQASVPYGANFWIPKFSGLHGHNSQSMDFGIAKQSGIP